MDETYIRIIVSCISISESGIQEFLIVLNPCFLFESLVRTFFSFSFLEGGGIISSSDFKADYPSVVSQIEGNPVLHKYH